jgi:hypothetical protein
MLKTSGKQLSKKRRDWSRNRRERLRLRILHLLIEQFLNIKLYI